MDDAEIVEMYWARNETALVVTAQRFGAYCRKIAFNILASTRDAEECENDTWLAAWNSMPQNRPDRLAPYLGRITRNLALDRHDKAAAQKRGGGQLDLVLEELSACLPAPGGVEDSFDAAETGRLISAFLRDQPEQARLLFVRRYWYCDPNADIARRYGMTEGAVRVSLHRTRARLLTYLKAKGGGGMTTRELFNAIGCLDDELILAADDPKAAARLRRSRRRLLVLRAAPAAAAVCLLAGGVWLWQGGKLHGLDSAMPSTGNMAGGGFSPAAAVTQDSLQAQDLDGSLPESADIEASADTAADDPAAANERAALQKETLRLAEPELAEALDFIVGMGSNAMYALSPEDLPLVDALGGEAPPETLPVYRNVLASHTVDLQAMLSRLAEALALVGYDPALAQQAQLAQQDKDLAAEWAQIQDISDRAYAHDEELFYWQQNLGTLELDLPGSEPGDPVYISVNPQLETTIRFVTGGEEATLPGAGQAAALASQAEQDYAGLLAWLGGTPVLDFYDDASSFTWFSGSGTATERLLSQSFRRITLYIDQAGAIQRADLVDADLSNLVGEYPVIPQETALALLAQGQYVIGGGLGGDAAQSVVFTRLAYNHVLAYYYVPCWIFTVDEGLANRPGKSEELHVYTDYYVPAIDLETLRAIVAG